MRGRGAGGSAHCAHPRCRRCVLDSRRVQAAARESTCGEGGILRGDVLSLMVGCRGAGRQAPDQLKDRQGQGARRKSRLQQQPSTRQYRTLQRWRPVKSPRTWPRGAGAHAAARRAANSCCPCPLKWPLSSMTIRHFCTNHSPNVARRPRAMRQSDAPRRALSEPPRPFFRAGNRSASRSERLRGRGRREERKPSLPKKQTRANGGVRKWGSHLFDE